MISSTSSSSREITPGMPMYEEAPDRHLHIPAGAKNKEDARTFLRFVARRTDVQTEWNHPRSAAAAQQEGARSADDKFIKAGFELLSNAAGLAQFYDRDTRPKWPRQAWRASRSS